MVFYYNKSSSSKIGDILSHPLVWLLNIIYIKVLAYEDQK